MDVTLGADRRVAGRERRGYAPADGRGSTVAVAAGESVGTLAGACAACFWTSATGMSPAGRNRRRAQSIARPTTIPTTIPTATAMTGCPLSQAPVPTPIAVPPMR